MLDGANKMTAFYTTRNILSDMQAAPLWDPEQCKFVGLLTVTDFIDILRTAEWAGKADFFFWYAGVRPTVFAMKHLGFQCQAPGGIFY